MYDILLLVLSILIYVSKRILSHLHLTQNPEVSRTMHLYWAHHFWCLNLHSKLDARSVSQAQAAASASAFTVTLQFLHRTRRHTLTRKLYVYMANHELMLKLWFLESLDFRPSQVSIES